MNVDESYEPIGFGSAEFRRGALRNLLVMLSELGTSRFIAENLGIRFWNDRESSLAVYVFERRPPTPPSCKCFPTKPILFRMALHVFT